MNKNIGATASSPIYSAEAALLDSSLIAQTNNKLYNVKLIKCGKNFLELYLYEETKVKKDKNWEENKYINNNEDKEYVFFDKKLEK